MSYASSFIETRNVRTSDPPSPAHQLTKRGHHLRASLRVAATEYVDGASAEKVREILRGAVRDFAPTVPLFDYAAFDKTIAVAKSQAKNFSAGGLPHDHGQVFLAPSKSLGRQYTNMTLKVRKQPAQFEMRDAFLAALCAWDFETAEQMARDYKLNVPAEGFSAQKIALFIHTLRGETKEALALLETFPHGYAAEFPPQRVELPAGVLRKDAKLIRSGIKAINTRFRTVWTVKTYATPAKLARLGNMSEMMPKIRDHIHWYDWLISHWAVAWVSLARHRKISGIFDDTAMFSQWIPWELCTEAARQPLKIDSKPPKRITKAGLIENLFRAIERDDVAELEAALATGVSLEALSLDRLTPLLFAAANGKTKTLRALLDKGANKKAVDAKSRDALALAATNGRAGAVEILLEAGFDANRPIGTRSPLLLAVMAKSPETVGVLLKGGADPNHHHPFAPDTPLAAACAANKPEIVKLLLKGGADPNAAVTIPPLHAVAEARNVEALKLLLEAKVDVALKDAVGDTALHSAARFDFVEGIETLLAAGANIEAKGFNGNTPLHVAADVGAMCALQLLLTRRAKTGAINDNGKTALECASDRAAKDLIKMGR